MLRKVGRDRGRNSSGSWKPGFKAAVSKISYNNIQIYNSSLLKYICLHYILEVGSSNEILAGGQFFTQQLYWTSLYCVYVYHKISVLCAHTQTYVNVCVCEQTILYSVPTSGQHMHTKYCRVALF